MVTKVAKVSVPSNFGVENLHNQFHGNVDVEFDDGSTMKVNSLILSWNSSVFDHSFKEMRLTKIEIKDYSKEAVILFLECLYSGDVKLEKSSFRELNKLSLFFKIDWLSQRCRECSGEFEE